MKRKAEAEGGETTVGGSNVEEVRITPLGAGQEVGRSCVLVEYMGKRVLLDCGLHPGKQGLQSLPYFDQVENIQNVDLCLISHFHLDHVAALPRLLGTQYNFQGKVYMTHPTKRISALLLKDFVRQSKDSIDFLYTEDELNAAMKRTQLINFYETINVNDIKVTAYRAGHVLGAAMFMIEIAGVRILYTGDYSRDPDRHMMAADSPLEIDPDHKPDVVIVESTYGRINHIPRDERERKFCQKIYDIVMNGGKVLLPVVALGRAQELLLLLENYWSRHPEMQHVNIYQTSSMARRASSIYQSFMSMMNEEIQGAFLSRNPFNFKFAREVSGKEEVLNDSGPCVVLATPSMLQTGLSRELFEEWCPCHNNGVIICDFAVQGTLAREVKGNPEHILSKQGSKIPMRMQVMSLAFSAHADCQQTTVFLNELQPSDVILVHGEANSMRELKEVLLSNAKASNVVRRVHDPECMSTVKIPIQPRLKARLLGSLAETVWKPGAKVEGIVWQKGFDFGIVKQEELSKYTQLRTSQITMRQSLALYKPWSDLRLALEMCFDGIEHTLDARRSYEGGEQGEILQLGPHVTLSWSPPDEIGDEEGEHGHVVLEWAVGSDNNLADAVIALIFMQGEESEQGKDMMNTAMCVRAIAKMQDDEKGVTKAESYVIATLMSYIYGKPIEHQPEKGIIFFEHNGFKITIDHASEKISLEPNDLTIAQQVEKFYKYAVRAARPKSVLDA